MKRWMTMLLASVLLMPGVGGAEYSHGHEQDKNIARYANVKAGDHIIFGTYEQDGDASNGMEPIEWLVLDEQDDKLLVISKYVLDIHPYNKESTDVTWETCTLRKWLNNDFLNTAFSSAEQTWIPTVTVPADKNSYCRTNPGNATQDKLFLLSIPEADKYFSSDRTKMSKPTTYVKKQIEWREYYTGYCYWWLRTPGSKQNSAAKMTNDCGTIFTATLCIRVSTRAAQTLTSC